MLKTLLDLPQSRLFWIAVIIFCIAFEGVALYFQYGLDYMPCVLCIHVRIGILGLLLTALIAVFIKRHWQRLLVLLILCQSLSIWLLERAYQLLGTERGFIEGGCGMDSGLPGWLPLDQWLPVMFQVWEPCGYTPELLWGITMAEALFVFFILFTLVNFFWIFRVIVQAFARPAI